MSETQPETKPWAILDTLTDGFAVLDAKTTIRYLNPAWKRLINDRNLGERGFGVGRDFLASFATVFAGADVRALAQGLRAVLAGESQHFQFTSPTHVPEADSQWFTTTIVPYPFNKELGALVQQSKSVAPAKPITQPALAAKPPKDQVVFRLLAETILAGLFIYRGSELWYANPFASLLTGYSTEELLAMNFWDVVHPDVRTMLHDWQPEIHGHFCLRNEPKVLTKQGQERWFDCTASIVDLDKEVVVIATALDVTERRQAEENLRQSEDRYRRLVESLPDIVLVCVEGKIVFINPAGATLLGEVQQQILHKPFLSLIHPDCQTFIQEQFLDLETKESSSALIEVKLCHRTGLEIPVEMEVVPLIYQQKAAIQIVARNITARKEAEERIQKYATRAGVLADVSQALDESGMDYQQILDTLARQTAEIIGDASVIRMISDNREHLELVSLYHSNPEALSLLRKVFSTLSVPANEGVNGRVLQTGQPVCIPVLSAEQSHQKVKPEHLPYLDRFGIYSILTSPLRVQGLVIGVVTLTRDTPKYPYTTEDQDLLQEIVDRAALALVNARLFGAMQQELVERQRAEKDLLESRDLYQQLTNSMNEGLVVRDENFVIISANQGFCRLLGYVEEEIVGRTMRDFLDEANAKILDGQREARRRGEKGTYELTMIRKDGQKIALLTSASPIIDSEGHFKGSFSVVFDITKHKQTESRRLAKAVIKGTQRRITEPTNEE